jgi:hypothetical protein
MSGEEVEMTASKHPNGREMSPLSRSGDTCGLYDFAGSNCNGGTRVHQW